MCQWIQVNSGTKERIETICMTGTNTAYFTAFNSTASSVTNSKTTNGGLNWFQFAASNIGGSTVYFINGNTGVLSGFNVSITTNAGGSWTTAYAPTDTAVVLDFHFPTSTVGYGVGMRMQMSTFTILGSLLIKTTNGGFSWTRLAPPISGSDMELKSVFFTDANTGYTVGWGPVTSIFLKTTNGGNNWSSLTAGTGGELYEVQFINANTGYVCGSVGTGISLTTNAGANWLVLNGNKTNDIFFINANTGFALVWNGIFRTNDAGFSWTLQTAAFSDDPLSVSFADNLNGFIAGKNGLVVKTTNGGGVWVKNISSEVPSTFSLSQNYPNPFNPSTNIRYQITNNLPRQVKLVVFDALGREVETLVNEKQSAGTYEATFDGNNLTSGVYFYRLTTDGFNETKKMLMIK
ncbi:MAG: YCF48-related protein, partial [Ignavibacteriae bacterium]|nr:YCF48-related protein [Ignavibacteriota bacterium]